MKIIITENKLNQMIIDFINNTYDVNNIGWTYGIDDWGNDVDYAALFYAGDFDDDETLFRWYDEGYWISDDMSNNSKESIKEWVEQSPILEFDDYETYDILTGYFGDRWKPILSKWFEDNFGFPVKTIKK